MTKKHMASNSDPMLKYELEFKPKKFQRRHSEKYNPDYERIKISVPKFKWTLMELLSYCMTEAYKEFKIFNFHP